jgi:hypothetical protein
MKPTVSSARPGATSRPRCSRPATAGRLRGLLAALLLLGVTVAGALAVPAPARAQCAMCRSAFDSPEGRRMIRKYQIGIAFLLVVPFAAFGTVTFFAIKGKRRLDRDGEA